MSQDHLAFSPKTDEKSHGVAKNLKDLPLDQQNLVKPLFEWMLNIEAVKNLIAQNISLNIRNEHGRTPLHWAAARGNFEVVSVLLEVGASVKEADEWGDTPLHRAAANAWNEGGVKVVKALLKSGALVNQTNKRGDTPLHCAAGGENLEAVNALLEAGASVKEVNENGSTPLHMAACGRGVEIAKVINALLKKGALINQANKQGYTPLHFAAEEGDEALNALLEAGASVKEVDERGNTPLHEAVMEWNVRAVNALLKKGAPVNQTNNDGRSPLISAALCLKQGISHSLDVGVALLNHGADFQKAESWLIVKNSTEGLSKEDAEKYAQTLTNLRFIYKCYQEEFVVSAKEKIKQEVSDAPRETNESKQTNIQTTEVSQLTADIQQGETVALSKVLATPAAQQSEPLQNYLQSQAIWTVLESEAKPGQKAEQIALLVEAPGVSLLVKNAQGQRPLDVALQQLTKKQINSAAVQKLQDATQKQLAEEEDYIFNAIEAHAQTASADVPDEKASSHTSTADPEDGPITPQQLAAEVQKQRAAEEALKQQFKAVSLPTPQPSTSSSQQPSPLPKPLRKVQKKHFWIW